MSYSNYQGFAQSEQERRDLADSLEEASKVMLGDPLIGGQGFEGKAPCGVLF